MKDTGRSRRLLLLTALLAGAGMAAAGCGAAGSSPAVGAPPASAHTAAEKAATLNWLAKTNQMRTHGDFAALSQVTTAEMRTIYQAEQHQAADAKASSGPAFSLTGLSITVPCHAGGENIFMAYADTDVFTLGQGMQPVAMVFQRAGGRWKLAAVVNRPGDGSGWPALCRQGTATAGPAELAPGRYAPVLASVLTQAMTGAEQTPATAVPFAVNGFLVGAGSVSGQAAAWIRQDRRAGDSFTGHFTAVPGPAFALPLANGRGYWVIGILIQSNSHSSPAGLRHAAWPDGTVVTTPRPAVVHHETDTYITTYAAIDPLRSAGATLTLDGFFGSLLTAVAS
jgi:hypothetical protein